MSEREREARRQRLRALREAGVDAFPPRVGPWVPVAVWSLTFLIHLFAGRLGVPTIKLWAPDS